MPVQLNCHNAGYIERLHQEFLRDPSRVAAPWQAYFRENDGDAAGLAAALPAPRKYSIFNPPSDGVDGRLDAGRLQDRVSQLIRAYRVRGHLAAHLDPLGMRRGIRPSSSTWIITGFPTPISTARFPPTTDRRARRRSRCGRSSSGCATPTAARSACSSCTSTTWRCATGCSERMESTREPPAALARRAAAHPHAADRRRDLRGVRAEEVRRAPRASRWKAPRA